MTEPNTVPFSASVTLDLPAYNEIFKGCRLHHLRSKLAPAFVIVIVILYICFFRSVDNAFLGKMLLIYFAFIWGMRLFHYLRDRNGTPGYKQMLSANNGKPSHLEYSFLDDGIHKLNTVTGGKTVTPYEKIHSIFETQNFIVCVLEHQNHLTFDKRSICGGPVSTFTKKLLAASPRIKRKKLASLLPGKISDWVFALFSVGCVLLALSWQSPTQLFTGNRVIDNTMDYRQIARELSTYGIDEIPEHVFQYIENLEQEYGPYTYYGSTDKCITLLTLAGMGTYEENTGRWSHSECGVYWFDMETYDLANMYTNLLLGISALDKETLCFTDLQEDVSDVDWHSGTGTQRISFSWNSNRYTLSARVDHDWYDLSVLNHLNRIIETETDGMQLYFAWDQGQGFLVFLGDAQWANRFETATGIQLRKDPLALNAMF